MKNLPLITAAASYPAWLKWQLIINNLKEKTTAVAIQEQRKVQCHYCWCFCSWPWWKRWMTLCFLAKFIPVRQHTEDSINAIPITAISPDQVLSRSPAPAWVLKNLFQICNSTSPFLNKAQHKTMLFPCSIFKKLHMGKSSTGLLSTGATECSSDSV